MASNMELNKMFATSSDIQPWWADLKAGENYCYPGATNRELFSASKADFDVSLDPVYDRNGEEVPGYFFLNNTSLGAPLRMAKGRFVPMQNETLFRHIDQLGKISDICAIGNGEKVCFSLEAGQFTVGEGSTIKQWINAVLPHDGSMKLTLGLGTLRIECQNTFNIWKRSLQSDEVFATKQTREADNKVSAWVKAFQEMQTEAGSLQEKFQRLARMKFSPEKQALVIAGLFPGKEGKDPSTRSLNIQTRLAQIIGDNASALPASQANTGWSLFNGITFYTSHEQSIKSNTSRLETNLFGTAQKFAETALEHILSAVPDDYAEVSETNLVRAISL